MTPIAPGWLSLKTNPLRFNPPRSPLPAGCSRAALGLYNKGAELGEQHIYRLARLQTDAGVFQHSGRDRVHRAHLLLFDPETQHLWRIGLIDKVNALPLVNRHAGYSKTFRSQVDLDRLMGVQIHSNNYRKSHYKN